MKEPFFEERTLNNDAMSSDNHISFIYFNLFNIQSHIVSFLSIMGLEDWIIKATVSLYHSHSVQLAYGFHELIEYLTLKKTELTWHSICEATFTLSQKIKKENNDQEAERLFYFATNLQKKLFQVK